ncbi:hypothetical protein, partial [uncultured Sphingomonas sp.]|uniref:hypothetical protein n=1 Tax=uncultured Sphingomonas sp. TaxID=158754 RepID=UPI0035C95CAE
HNPSESAIALIRKGVSNYSADPRLDVVEAQHLALLIDHDRAERQQLGARRIFREAVFEIIRSELDHFHAAVFRLSGVVTVNAARSLTNH